MRLGGFVCHSEVYLVLLCWWLQFTGVLILYVLLLELAANQYVTHSNI